MVGRAGMLAIGVLLSADGLAVPQREELVKTVIKSVVTGEAATETDLLSMSERVDRLEQLVLSE
eukprot:CAMPEP_0173413770 /NCGR_PEP_ID=MMETSP1356-20130122/82814_1 /TAXON_ID=77927 ORGANISM="Hemiselmis virescens, Strain PCC157" /NCGR_SAMPLE_ID=MMETSP1356 /ASSEMBLY_ACC=CAM_ASM_000847 /LENGTH=63 /DNA_ID=CAMNT_0014375851 /DNA_START=42 /DNA_END=230 /DNA_ORIENTATION=-